MSDYDPAVCRDHGERLASLEVTSENICSTLDRMAEHRIWYDWENGNKLLTREDLADALSQAVHTRGGSPVWIDKLISGGVKIMLALIVLAGSLAGLNMAGLL